MDWIAYAFQGPEAAVADALTALRGTPGAAQLIRPEEGAAPLPLALNIPGHALFGYALPGDAPAPAAPAGCFDVGTRLAAVALGVGPEQG